MPSFILQIMAKVKAILGPLIVKDILHVQPRIFQLIQKDNVLFKERLIVCQATNIVKSSYTKV